MKSTFIKHRLWVDCCLLFFVLLIYAINLFSLVRADLTPPSWDESVHLRDSLVFYNVLTNPGQINLDMIRDIVNKSEEYPLFRPSGYYPPLVPVFTAFWYLFLGTSSVVAILSNLVFIGVLLFSTYALGATLFDRNIGLLSAVFVATFPIILQHSVVYMLDLPLTALVALGIWLVVKTENFSNRLFSLLAGVCFGLGMLTKWTFLFFALGPLCYAGLKAVRRKDSQPRGEASAGQAMKNILLFIVAAVLTFGPYYFPILGALIRETLHFSSSALAQGPKDLFSLASFAFYPIKLWQAMISPLSLLLFVLGVIGLAISSERNKIFLLIWLAVPYLIFTVLIENKHARYMMPWLPAIALTMAFGIRFMFSKKLHPVMANIGKFAIPGAVVILAIVLAQHNDALKASIVKNSRLNWHINEIVSLVAEDMRNDGHTDPFNRRPRYLGVIPDHQYVNGQTIRYFAAQRKLPLNVIKLQNYRGTAYEEFAAKFDRYHYLLSKDGQKIARASFQESVDKMDALLRSRTDSFVKMSTFAVPDGSTLTLFKRIEAERD